MGANKGGLGLSSGLNMERVREGAELLKILAERERNRKKEVSQLARGLRTRLTDMGDLDPKLVEFLKQKNAQVTSLPEFLALVREYNEKKEAQKDG